MNRDRDRYETPSSEQPGHLPGGTPAEWQQSRGSGMITGKSPHRKLQGGEEINAFVTQWIDGNVKLGSAVWGLGQTLRIDAQRAGFDITELEQAMGNIDLALALLSKRVGG